MEIEIFKRTHDRFESFEIAMHSSPSDNAIQETIVCAPCLRQCSPWLVNSFDQEEGQEEGRRMMGGGEGGGGRREGAGGEDECFCTKLKSSLN